MEAFEQLIWASVGFMRVQVGRGLREQKVLKCWEMPYPTGPIKCSNWQAEGRA